MMRKKLRKLPKREASGHPQISKNLKKSSKVPVDVSFWMVLGQRLATMGHQDAHRTKTRGGNSNPIAPARSKHSLHFCTKLENVPENPSACIHFGPHIATLGAKIHPKVSLGAFQKESEISNLFVTRLGAKLPQKDPLKWTG